MERAAASAKPEIPPAFERERFKETSVVDRPGHADLRCGRPFSDRMCKCSSSPTRNMFSPRASRKDPRKSVGFGAARG